MFFTWFIALLFSLPALAVTSITTNIHDIDFGHESDSQILILLESGNVIKIPKGKSVLLDDLIEIKDKQITKTFKIDNERFLIEITESKNQLIRPSIPALGLKHDPNYIPTTIDSMDTARKYFKQARYNPKESQCFNRAMIWSYEWWKKHSLKSMKVLVYFTRTYIRRYNFEWWFHIAPYVHVMHEGKVVERVMDIKYSSGPRTIKQWTDIFLSKDPECPAISKFSEYADNPYIGDCYIQKTTMFTYQPADLQMYEAWNYTKSSFLMREVKQAYLEAYDERI